MNAKSRTLKNDPCNCPMCTVARFIESQKDSKEAMSAFEKILAKAELDATDLWALRRKAQMENGFWFEGKFWRQEHGH